MTPAQFAQIQEDVRRTERALASTTRPKLLATLQYAAVWFVVPALLLWGLGVPADVAGRIAVVPMVAVGSVSLVLGYVAYLEVKKAILALELALEQARLEWLLRGGR